MNKLLNREIGEYIIEYDPKRSYGENYQFSGLIIKDINGDEISLESIKSDEIDEDQKAAFIKLQEKINDEVGQDFCFENKEDFLIGLPVDGISISIEPM